MSGGARNSHLAVRMPNLIELLLELERDSTLHESRMLILLGIFAGRKGTGGIEGLTQLAKLDFLLRYPTYLRRALQAREIGKDVKLLPFETRTVESRMIRFRYGPWDFRYRRFLNILIAKGLVTVQIDGRRVRINLTPSGLSCSKQLADMNPDQVYRARILKAHFSWKGTKLKQFIYETFPEIANLRLGQEIPQ